MTRDDITRQECSDPTLGEFLSDYFANRLDEASRSRLEEHLKDCEACRQCLALMRMLDRSSKTPSTELADHFPDDLLLDYYSDKSRLNRHLVTLTEEHLRTCSTCKHKMELLIGLEQDLSPDEANSSRTERASLISITRKIVLHPVFAYAAAALLAYPAYRWMTGGPDQIIMQPVGGSIPGAVVLHETRRGADDVPMVERIHGQSVQLFQLPYRALPYEKVYRFGISTGSSPDAPDIRAYADLSDPNQINLLLDCSALVDGQWILHVYEIDRSNAADTVFTDYLFRLVTK